MRQPSYTLIRPLLFALLILHSFILDAQGIKGKVTDARGEALPFASIALVGTNDGIASNIEAEYLITLASGRHHLRFLYLGFAPLDTTILVGQSMVTFNARLQEEVVVLPEAVVSGRGEDPAYTIMRRAIAKAKYHSMQVDEYNAQVYVKGSGRLLKVPGLFKKKILASLAEEGIDSTVAFTQESVSKVHYTRPDQYQDTIISIRTTGDDNNTSPMEFIYSSFYEPRVVNAISPLAPDAFLHYKFEYVGFIEDEGEVINKIKVTPRARGDQVFEGVIYIVDQVWSIHSIDLTTYVWGIKFGMQQQFSAVVSNVWLPVHEIYDVSGSVFGFGFEYRYFARLSEYDIKLNPDLEVPVVVLDEKVETEEAKASDAKIGNRSFENGLSSLESGEELSVKKLRKMMKEYEKQEIEALPDNDSLVISGSHHQIIDSTAFRRDSSYWESIRPMPLTGYEVKGYVRQDSIAALQPKVDEDKKSDTLSVRMNNEGFAANVKKRSKFSITHLITGGKYDLSDKTFLQLKAPLQSFNYNTVDGFHAGYEIEIGTIQKQKINWEAGPSVSYAISREAFNYEGKVKLYGKGWDLQFNGGDQVRQFNFDHAMSLWANSFYTLLANKNYLKEFEEKFARVRYSQNLTKAMGIDVSAEYGQSHRLINTTDLVFFDDKDLLYSSNDPVHLAGGPEVFNDHKSITTDASLWIKPFWEYRVQNGSKRKDYRKSPMLTLRYRKGWGDDYNPFNLVSADLESKWSIGAGSQLSFNISGGTFFGSQKPSYFQDFVHFPGNKLISTPINPVSSFRMLDYYTYSTNDRYLYGLFNYQFRRFALTQMNYFRRQGIRENVLFNVLLTPESRQYAEVGYAINYILRFLRIEFVTSWQEYKYQDFAVRVGVATDFQSILGGF
ncbi:MAG: DUF5686 family protein [Saprospiraceae bacterium]